MNKPLPITKPTPLSPDIFKEVVAPSPVVKAEEPREMTGAHRIAITSKILEVYTDKGYGGAYSDQKIADEMKVPRAWVSKCREPFGADINLTIEQANADVNKLIEEVASFKAEVHALQLTVEDLVRAKQRLLTDASRFSAEAQRLAKLLEKK